MSNERHSGRDSPGVNKSNRPMSRSPDGKTETQLPPTGTFHDITRRSPDRRPTRHGAFGDLAAFHLAYDSAATIQTDKKRLYVRDKILEGPRYVNAIDTYQRNLREKEYVIHIESLSIQRNDDDGIFNKVDFGFWVPVHADYSIRININFDKFDKLDKLHDSDKENMEKVVFWNSRWGKICRLLDLYLCTQGVLSDYIVRHFMGLEFKNKSYGLKHSLEMAFEDGYLTIEGYNNQPLLAVILKAGELSDNYKGHTRPYLLGMIRTVLRNRPQRGGRVQRQRRRGRTILSRKKRNTRMKKYKRHNKSKKIKS